jgi:hypothetical protein
VKKALWFLFPIICLQGACKDKEEEMPPTIKSTARFNVHVTDSLSGNVVSNARFYIVGCDGTLKTIKPSNTTDSEGNFSFVLERVDDFRNSSHGIFNDFYITVIKDSLFGRLNISTFYNYNATSEPKDYTHELKLSKPSVLKLRVRDALIVKSTEIEFADSLLIGERVLNLSKQHNTVLDTTMYFSVFRNSRNEVTHLWRDTLNHGIYLNIFYLRTTKEDTTYLELLY